MASGVHACVCHVLEVTNCCRLAQHGLVINHFVRSNIVRLVVDTRGRGSPRGEKFMDDLN